MSNPIDLKRGAGLALAIALALSAVPAAAHAAAVNLATVSPFVVLGGSTVTNTGPSVLNGNLGVAPGTALVGFGLPATVNGSTHANDAVARQAQADLITAYNSAAGQPVAAANDLTGTNLGNRTLAAAAYRYTSSAQLTGVLTLDAQGDPNAQFVFQIASALTTAPASAVRLVNGASPCNVFWQIGSSATLDTTTAFQGNLMALTSISLNDGASVRGRVLARNGQVSLINNVIDRSMCGAGSSLPAPSPGAQAPGAPVPGAPTNTTAPGDSTSTSTARGRARITRTSRATCTSGFHARVRGRMIRRVVFSLDGRRIATRTKAPFSVYVQGIAGRHNVRARVTFTDATRARTLNLGYRVCAAAVRNPRRGPSQFTG
ncbi:MAG TPA: ice-binding family protein [Solirubrobacteraceae bacterium]|nr:ice-binding family protein [Solirubrobacteraceae bacterium]